MKSIMQNSPSDENLPSRAARTKRKSRDLVAALMLRPAEVFALYGIPTSTICVLCKHQDPVRRLPSKKILGRCGRKGLRLIPHDGLRAYLAKWDSEGLAA
jgi:hypothetical protein